MKVTWNDIKNSVYQLMSLESDEYTEYEEAIITSANEAIAKIVKYFPPTERYQIVQEVSTEEGMNEYNISELTEVGNERTFIGFGGIPVMKLVNGAAVPYTAYATVLDKYLYLPKNEDGTFYVNYNKYPQRITMQTENTHELEFEPEVSELMPYYIAARVYADDDNAMATYYRNVFENSLAAMVPKVGYAAGISVSGGVKWL